MHRLCTRLLRDCNKMRYHTENDMVLGFVPSHEEIDHMKKAIWLLLLATLFACGPSTTATQPTSTDAEEADTFVAEQTSDESEAEPETETETSAPAAADLDDFVPATTVESVTEAAAVLSTASAPA